VFTNLKTVWVLCHKMAGALGDCACAVVLYASIQQQHIDPMMSTRSCQHNVVNKKHPVLPGHIDQLTAFAAALQHKTTTSVVTAQRKRLINSHSICAGHLLLIVDLQGCC
jgi:hypothetical protein